MRTIENYIENYIYSILRTYRAELYRGTRERKSTIGSEDKNATAVVSVDKKEGKVLNF